jgi:serine/threonine protein kinase
LGTVTQDSLPVLVLEDLGDIEIGKVIKNEGPFRKNTTLRITETILDVDECLAENGVFHRDQKPSNIIYVPKRGPVLIDFGLSDCDEEGGSIYGRGRVIGTPLYMDDQTADGYHEGEKSEVYSVAMNYLAMRIGENRLEPRLGPEWGAQFRRELRENIKTQLPKLEEDEREIIQRNLSERIRERQNFAEFRDSIRKIRSGVKQIETSQTLDSKTDNRWIITVATAAKALLAKIIEKR